MTKFEYLYKRAYSAVLDQYRSLHKYLRPFLVRSGDSKTVSRFEINAFGSVSFKFVCKTNALSFACIHIATSCNVYHSDSDFCLTFNDLQFPSVSNFNRLVYLHCYFSYVYASLKVDYDHLCDSLAHFDFITIDECPF